MKSRFAREIFNLVLLAGISTTASAQMMINGAGATFPYPIYSKWFDEYAKIDPSVRFNYQSIGSGGGQKQILAQTVDFGASDGPMSDENLSKAPGKLLHIPTVAGADVVAYNLSGNPALKFDADTIAGIFLGQIKKWNDPKITALNPGVTVPDQEIVVVHRWQRDDIHLDRLPEQNQSRMEDESGHKYLGQLADWHRWQRQ